MSNKVSLNGKTLLIEGGVTKAYINPWSAKMSMGSQDFADYAPASVREYKDARGGIGLDSETEQTDRVSWSESMELTKEGYWTLGALVTTLDNFETPPLLMIDFEGYTYVWGTSKSEYNNAGTMATADPSPLATPTDVIVFQDATDTYLIYCNGSDVRYASVGFGGSQNWAALSTSDVKFLTAFDKRLMGVNSTGTTIFYSARDNCDDANGGAMSSFNISGPWSAAYCLFAGRAFTSDDDVIYMVTDLGLVVIDFWTRVAYLTDVTWGKTSYALRGCNWNASVFASNGPGITKASQGTFTDTWGPDADDGLPSGYTGYIYDMKGLTHWLVIAVSGGTYSSILKRHSTLGGWHQVYSSSSNIRCIHHTTLSSPNRLYFGEGNYIKYMDFPDVTRDVSRVSGFDFAAQGSVILPRLSKVSTLPKIAVMVAATTKNCDIVTENHTEKVEVYIRVNDTDSWGSAVGTFSTNGRPTPIKLGTTAGQGTAFYDIQVKLIFYRGTASVEVSPVIKSICLYFKPNPEPVMSYSFNLAARGTEAKRIITDLESAKAATTLLKFYPDGDTRGTAKWVQIESMPSRFDLDNIAKEERLTIVVSEVVYA
jgi:hypothetical protein